MSDARPLGWELYGLALEDFTAARNDLVKKLKGDGDDEGAAFVKALKKPKLSAWVVNQLVRSRRDDIDGLIAATEETAAATDPSDMRGAAKQRQSIIARLVDVAGQILDDAGHAAGPITMHEIVQTLQATADEAARAEIVDAMLVEPPAPTGFFGLTGAVDLQDEALDVSGEDGERAKQIARLEEDIARAKRIADEKFGAADRARDRAAAAEEAAARAREEVERLTDELIALRDRA